jgi:hypothetical protein
MLQAVGIFAIAAIGRPSRWLDVSRAPRLGAESPQRRRRVKSARANLDIIGLQYHAALPRPKILQIGD